MKTVNDLVEELRKCATVDGKLWLTDDDKKEPAQARILIYKNENKEEYNKIIEIYIEFNTYFLNRGKGKYNIHIFETEYLSQEEKEKLKQCLRLINKYLEETI